MNEKGNGEGEQKAGNACEPRGTQLGFSRTRARSNPQAHFHSYTYLEIRPFLFTSPLPLGEMSTKPWTGDAMTAPATRPRGEAPRANCSGSALALKDAAIHLITRK